MLRCARCGQANPENLRFCGNCGMSLMAAPALPGIESQPPPPARVIPNAGGAWICSQCGGFVRIDAEKCKHCGIALIPAQQPNTSKRGGMKAVLIILGIVGALTVGCILLIGVLTLLGQRVGDIVP